MTDTETDTLDVLEDHDTVAKGEIVGCGVKETLAEEDTDAELLVVLDAHDSVATGDTVGSIVTDGLDDTEADTEADTDWISVVLTLAVLDGEGTIESDGNAEALTVRILETLGDALTDSAAVADG